jgi:hypothetical protein
MPSIRSIDWWATDTRAAKLAQGGRRDQTDQQPQDGDDDKQFQQREAGVRAWLRLVRRNSVAGARTR